MVWRTLPPPKCRPVPRARLWKADAIAERCSESSFDRSAERPINSPSAESTTACRVPTTRPTRSSSSQFRSLPGPAVSLFTPVVLPVMSIRSGLDVPSLTSAALEGGHRVPYLLRGRVRGRVRVLVPGLRDGLVTQLGRQVLLSLP